MISPPRLPPSCIASLACVCMMAACPLLNDETGFVGTFVQMFHTHAPQQRGFFGRRKLVADACGFTTNQKRPDNARPCGRSKRGRSKCRRPHDVALLVLGWRPAAGIACLPRCQGGRTNSPRIHDQPDRCVGLGVV